MSKTPVGPDLLESLQILSQLVVQVVSQDLAETTVLNILLSVEEPIWDLVLAGVGHHSHHSLNLKKSKIHENIKILF